MPEKVRGACGASCYPLTGNSKMLAASRRRLVAIVGAGALLTAANASAQASRQVWANFTFDWVKPSGLTYEIDFEPKALVVGPT